MKSTANQVLEFIRENDVKFIRLGFCDLLGVQKNISLLSDELESAFENGVPFDASSILGFRDSRQSDLLLFPDPSTLTVLPWRPDPGRVVRFFCDIKMPNGEYYKHNSRYILKNTLKNCTDLGYNCRVGSDCEFYLFKTDDNSEPTYNTLDYGSYLDISPLDKGENIRREICLNLEEMGLMPETSHHEKGPGQNQIDFKSSDALSCADNFLTFKSVVKAISARNGLYASFMPKPLEYESGSSLRINITLSQKGHNVFGNQHDEIAESFIAGVMEKAAEISLFLSPIMNSYDRLGKLNAPRYVTWSHQNRAQLIRVPLASKDKIRMELRSADPTINPYLAFSLIIEAGLYGIKNNLKLVEAIDIDLNTATKDILETIDMLPKDIYEAVKLAENSSFIKDVLGESLLNKYISIKKEEIDNYEKAENKKNFITKKYFYYY